MADMTVLSERDKDLVAAGHWPIDVEEARPLNAAELARRHKRTITDHNGDVYEPWVRNGYIEWRKRASA